MKFFDIFKKKQVTIPAKKETAKKEERKQYLIQELDEIVDNFYKEIIQKIGKGQFRLGYDLSEYTKLYAVLALNKNEPIYNSLFRDLFDTFKYTDISFELKYDGLMDFCKQAAEENNITVELTEWSVENIIVSYDDKVDTWSYFGSGYYYSNKKTVADYAREKCFAW